MTTQIKQTATKSKKETWLSNLPDWDTNRPKYNARVQEIRNAIKNQCNDGKKTYESKVEATVAEHVTGLTDFGNFDLENFADLLKEIDRAVSSEPGDHDVHERWDIEALSFNNRVNFSKWMSEMISFFRCLAYDKEELTFYNDYWKLGWMGSLTESELEELEEKYLSN